MVLSYVKGVSEGIRWISAPIKIKVCIKPHQTLRNLLSKPNDQLPPLQRSGVVYRIPCGDCHVYIGQTGRRLSDCIMEYKRAVRQADFISSALSEHVWSAGHHIDWDNVSVLATCPDYHHRIVTESFKIRATYYTLKRDTGSLPAEYYNLT